MSLTDTSTSGYTLLLKMTTIVVYSMSIVVTYLLFTQRRSPSLIRPLLASPSHPLLSLQKSSSLPLVWSYTSTHSSLVHCTLVISLKLGCIFTTKLRDSMRHGFRSRYWRRKHHEIHNWVRSKGRVRHLHPHHKSITDLDLCPILLIYFFHSPSSLFICFQILFVSDFKIKLLLWSMRLMNLIFTPPVEVAEHVPLCDLVHWSQTNWIYFTSYNNNNTTVIFHFKHY